MVADGAGAVLPHTSPHLLTSFPFSLLRQDANMDDESDDSEASAYQPPSEDDEEDDFDDSVRDESFVPKAKTRRSAGKRR